MDQTHQEYVEYYKVRAGRAAESGIYLESAVIEKERADAIAACTQPGDFEAANQKGDFGNRLAAANARDQARARLAHFTATEETVRAAGEKAILDAAATPRDVFDLMTAFGEIENKTSIALIIDAAVDEFYDAFDKLETIEMWETADVPAEWKAKDLEKVQRTIKEETADFAETIRRVREYKSDWEFDYKLIGETRHRRRIPVSDDVVRRRIEGFKRLIGAKGGA